MKAWTITAILWLLASAAALAQPRDGPPSITQLYGPNPASPPNLFQNAPQMTAVPGPDQGNNTLSPQKMSIGNSAPPGPTSSVISATLANPAGGNATAAVSENTTIVPAAGNATARPIIPTVMRDRPASLGPDLQNVVMPTTMGAIDNQRRLRVNDQIVYQVEEDRQPPKVLFVDASGNINVPYGPEKFPAANLTLRELAQNIVVALTDNATGNYFNATVLLELYHGSSRGQINIVGEVAHPSSLEVPLDKALTLFTALGQVGGFTPQADIERILIVHNDPDDPGKESKSETVDYKAMIDQGKVNNIVLQPGDFVNVPSKGDTSGSVFVTGEVGGSDRMASIPIPAGRKLTLTQAITQAGGWTQWSSKNVVLIRPGKDGKDTRRTIDVSAIADGDAKDVDLQAGDHVIVNASIFSFGFH